MKCRHCGADLEEGAKLCPSCGKTVGKPKIWQVILFAAVGFVVGFALCLVILADQGVDMSWLNPAAWFAQEETAEPAEEENELFEFDLTRDNFNAVEDSDPNAVVATMGDLELTNGELNMYYLMGVYTFLSDYQYYLDYFGLDLSKPLDEQTYQESEDTWQEVFLQNALYEWRRNAALTLEGKAAGHTMSQTTADEYAAFRTKAEQGYKDEGYDTLDAMLKEQMGAMFCEPGYWAYMEANYYADDYYSKIYDSLEPTEEQILAYFDAHASELSFDKETKSHDVRHILIEPKGGTENEYGTKDYTQEEYAACLKEAEAVFATWDGTEEGFAKLAQEKSVDTGSAANGGLYTGLTMDTNFVEEFKNWYLDPVRKVGDTGIVQSPYGYHIMYYSGGATVWHDNCKSLAWQEASTDFVEDAVAKWPVTLFEDKIAIGELKLS